MLVKILLKSFYHGKWKIPSQFYPVSDGSSNNKLKEHTFLGEERMEKPHDQTQPPFPVFGDNFCKVDVNIIDLLDFDSI